MTTPLAIHGGTPLAEPFSPWQWPPPSYRPDVAIARYLETGGSLVPKGRDGVIAECEDALCARFQQPRAVLCSSGTMALYAAFFAIGLGPGDEIICPTITFHATATPALHLGAKVVFVDVNSETGCIDPAALSAAITSRTRAVVTNAQWGHPVDQEAIRALCDRHHLAWVEDISHAHCAEWQGRQVGTWGDLACASLGAEKILTGGVGGVLFGSRNDLVDRAVLVTHYLHRSKTDIRSPGFEPIGRTGYGLKLGIHPLAAAVVLDQIQSFFDGWIESRKNSLMRLRTTLAGLEGITPPVIHESVTAMGGWYGFKPWIDFKAIGISRRDLVNALKAEGAEVDEPGSPPLHTLALFHDPQFPVGRWEKAPVDPAAFPNANRYSAGTLSIPTLTGPEDEERLTLIQYAFEKVWNNLDQLRDESHKN